MSDVNLIMEKVREAVKDNYREFVCNCLPEDATSKPRQPVFISYESLKKALINVLGDSISNHEIITLCRFFSAEQSHPSMCDKETVRAAVHLELKRSLWNALDEVKEHLHHINPMNKPFIAEVKLRSTLKGCRLPFSLELIDDIMNVLNRNDCDEIEVCDFMNFLDAGCGKPPELTPINIAFELCPKVPFLHKGRVVNFTCFLEQLGLDQTLKKDA